MIVGKWFQVLFHSAHCGSFHLSLTVLVRYRCSSSIQGWRVVSPASARISRVLTYSGSCYLERLFHIRDYHPLWLSFPECSIRVSPWILQSSTPVASYWFALFPVRSPLLRESLVISFPLVTEMFHFTRFAPFKVIHIAMYWVAPFGNLWIKASQQLPIAYRSLVRPSSPLLPKASTICPSQA